MGKKIITARVLNIMQYEKHPKTNEELINENQIKSALEHKTIKQWAYIAHTEDVYTEDDELNNPDYKAGAKKPKHWHIVIRCDRAVELPVIAKWFGIEENYIEVAKGRGAFLDCVEYLTHESETQQALGKHLYSDKEVKANFDFRKELEDRESMILKYGRDLTPKDRMRYDVLYLGKTLKQCMNEDEILYMNDIEKLKKLRLEYISRQKVPSTRLNYYIAGQGGYGKDIASRALARSLYPQYEDDDDIFFEVGASEIVELPLFDPKGEEEGETWSELMSGDIDLTELCEEKKAG